MTTNTRFALFVALAVCTIMSGLIGLQLAGAFAQTNATGAGNQTGNQTGNQSSMTNSATPPPVSGQQAGTPDY
jgi:hypothetical protein